MCLPFSVLIRASLALLTTSRTCIHCICSFLALLTRGDTLFVLKVSLYVTRETCLPFSVLISARSTLLTRVYRICLSRTELTCAITTWTSLNFPALNTSAASQYPTNSVRRHMYWLQTLFESMQACIIYNHQIQSHAVMSLGHTWKLAKRSDILYINICSSCALNASISKAGGCISFISQQGIYFVKRAIRSGWTLVLSQRPLFAKTRIVIIKKLIKSLNMIRNAFHTSR